MIKESNLRAVCATYTEDSVLLVHVNVSRQSSIYFNDSKVTNVICYWKANQRKAQKNK